MTKTRAAAYRICILTSVHSPFDVRVFHKEGRSLARAGYEVTLIAPHERDEVVDGIVIKSLPSVGGRVSRMTRTVWKVYRKALRQDADIYHFHDPELIPVGLLLRARGKKVIYDIHEDYPEAILSKYYLRPWIRRPVSWVMERFENFASCRFSALVAATPAIANRFGDVKSRVRVVQNFPVAEELTKDCHPTWDQRQLSVTYVGGISENRGAFEMVRAVALIPPTLPATLKLVGDFSPSSLRHELAPLAGWEKVEVLRFMDRAGVARVLNSVRAGLVLIHPEPRYKVAYPIKMFEYMAVGIPVIAADFPLWREIIEEAGCGLVVNPLDPQAIAGAIEYLLTHTEEAEAMGRRGREAVEKKYNWGTEEKKLLALYDEVLANA